MPEERDPFESTRMSLGEHLAELRKRLFRGVLALFLAFIVGMYYYIPIGEALLRPLRVTIQTIRDGQVEKYERLLAEDPARKRSEFFTSDEPANKELQERFTISNRPVVTAVTEGLWYGLKVSLVFAFAAGGPVLLWQMWQFIAAGLYPRERRVVFAYFPASVALFVGGVLFGYYLLLPFCMRFLATAFPVEQINTMFKLAEYWEFLFTMTFALGLVFQLPIVMFALVHVDLVSRAAFARFRKYFVLVAFVIGGVVTPPDPWSQSMVAIPMILLYEIGLLATLPIARRRAKEQVS